MLPPPIPLPLGPAAKLDALRRLDHHRRWDSLDDARRCLQCGKRFTGREIQILVMKHKAALLDAHCPTPGCKAAPADWALIRDIDRMAPGAEEMAVLPPPRFFQD